MAEQHSKALIDLFEYHGGDFSEAELTDASRAERMLWRETDPRLRARRHCPWIKRILQHMPGYYILNT